MPCVDRSPWSNEYDPPLDDGTVPSAKLRKLEVTANEAFDTYREMYVCPRNLLRSYSWTCHVTGTSRAASPPYSSGTSKMAASLVSSCSRSVRRVLYFHLPLLTAMHLLVALSPSSATEPSGSWDSIHVFEVAERGRQGHYKLTSTIMLSMVDRGVAQSSKEDKVEGKRDGEVTLSGSMTRQVSSLFGCRECLISSDGLTDGAGSFSARPDITHYKHWAHDRGYGD